MWCTYLDDVFSLKVNDCYLNYVIHYRVTCYFYNLLDITNDKTCDMLQKDVNSCISDALPPNYQATIYIVSLN